MQLTKQNKKGQPTKEPANQSKIILHGETVVFSGKSFVKRENLDRQLDRKGSKQ